MKHLIRIRTRAAKSSPQVIELKTRIKTERNDTLYETLLVEADGVYRLLNGLPKEILDEKGKVVSREDEKIAKVTIDLVTTETGNRKFWHHDFVYYDYESEFPEGVSKRDNDAVKTIVAFLRKHQEISVKNKKGEEVNKNIIPSMVMYDFIDTTEKVEDAVKEKLFAIEASVKLKEWYEEDKLNPKRLINFAYLWGMENVSSIPPNALFSKLVEMASQDMPKFNATMEHIESDIAVNVLKARQIKVRGEFIIQEVGTQFVFNTIPIGSNTKEMVMFFSLKDNIQQYTLLKNELGVKDYIPQIELPLAPKEPSVDMVKNTSKSKQEIDREDKALDNLKNKISDKIRRVLINGQDATAEKVNNRYQMLSETGRLPEQCLVELIDVYEIRENATMQEWYQAEIEAIKKEVK